MRKRTRGVLFLALISSSGAVIGACASGGSTDDRANVAGDSTSAADPGAQSSSSADVLDVKSGSRMSLALRGGMGPIVSGQTITKATVSLSDLELVDESGQSVALSSAPFTGDLVALQDQLGSIFAQQSVQAGRYTAMRFRLGGAAIEAQDGQGAASVYATQGFDTSQFSQVSSVQTLQLSGLDANGFVTCALPPGGLVVSGDASLALQFAFAQSLTVQSGGAWVLAPHCWLVDQSAFSSLDVDFEFASSVTSYQQYLQSGFQVILLDSNLYPVCEVPLVVFQSATFRAHFVYISWFQGPFVAALLPPAGFQLQSAVALSVDVQQSAVFSASISVTSFSLVSGRSFSIGTDRDSRIEHRDRHGNLLGQTTEPIGAVEDVAPTTHHREPVTHGEQQPTPAETPQLPGNPPPKRGHEHGAPPGMPAPTSTGGEMMPPPTPTSTEHGHGMMPPAPTSTSTGPGTTPPAPTSTATEHGKMPPAPTSTSTGPGTTPPTPTPPSTGPRTPPPAPPSTSPGPATPPSSTPPPAGTGAGAPSRPGRTGTPPPATPAPATTGAPTPPPSGGRGPTGGGPTSRPAGPPPSSGGRHGSIGSSLSTGGPYPSFTGGREPAAGSAPPATKGSGRGRGIDTRTH
ncbi:MAG TPA: hypothetical protein VF765_24985 [Polyangiaceae bacterium]